MDRDATERAIVFLLLAGGAYELPIDRVEWTDPKYYHQN